MDISENKGSQNPTEHVYENAAFSADEGQDIPMTNIEKNHSVESGIQEANPDPPKVNTNADDRWRQNYTPLPPGIYKRATNPKDSSAGLEVEIKQAADSTSTTGEGGKEGEGGGGGGGGENNPDQDYSLLTLLPFVTDAFQKVKKSMPIRDEDWPWVTKFVISLLFGLGYVGYVLAVLLIHTDLEDGDYWCDGDGMLIILTSIVMVGLLYFQVIKPFFGKQINKAVIKPLTTKINSLFSHALVAVVFTLIVFGALLAFLIVDAWNEIHRLQSLIGIVVLILGGFLFSAAPGKVKWRHIFWGLAIQFVMGLLILKWPVGEQIFDCLSGKVTTFLAFTDIGSAFVFGDDLVLTLQVFAFKVLPVTLFFSFCIQILYYFGVMQWIVLKMGWLLQISIGTTACESVNAAANIFLGQTEAPLLIKPYLWRMTKSEIHAVMTGGFATIAGSVMAAYISFGIDAASLLSASVMNAPAALALSKLFYPEVEVSTTTTKDIKIGKGDEANWLHAAMTGVSNALPMIANIAANLICFYAFVALLSHVTNWLCMLAGTDDGVCTIENIFGYIYMPLAWVLGVQWAECHKVGELIGMKTIINEFKAYDELSKMLKANELSKRAELISTYALCGFANISSIGIVLGGLGAMAPERKHDMATIVVRAMIAGSCASFLTSCVAGTMLSDSDVSRNDTTTIDFNITTTVTSLLDDTVF